MRLTQLYVSFNCQKSTQTALASFVKTEEVACTSTKPTTRCVFVKADLLDGYVKVYFWPIRVRQFWYFRQYLMSANVVCEGYVFTPVCHSVHGEGALSVSVHAGIHPPGRHTPLGYTRPGQTHPGRHTPWADTPLPQADIPLGKHSPGQTPPCLLGACWDTQCPVHAGIDMATAANGTHPTWMHSCMSNTYNWLLFK